MISEKKLKTESEKRITTISKNGLVELKTYLNKPLLRQLLICGPIWISYFVSGLIAGSSATDIFHQRQRNETNNTENETAYSWWSSSVGATSLPWIFILPILMNFIGRKMTFIFTWFGIFITYSISYFASSHIQALSSDVIFSITVTCGQTVAPAILAEYSSVKYRGTFLSFKSATFFLGMWIARAYGNSFYWRNLGLLSFLFFMYFSIVVLWPESPYWSASKGRFTECVVSHRWLKGKYCESETELEAIIRSTKDHFKKAENDNVRQKNAYVIKDIFRKVSSPEFYKPLWINVLLIIHFECSGKLALKVCALDILKKIIHNEFLAYKTFFIFDIILVFFAYIGCVLTIFMSRRTLYLNFSATSFLFVCILSFYLHLINLNLISNNHYVSLSFTTLNLISFSLGPVALCSSLFAELMPLSYKSLFLIILGLFVNVLNGISISLTSTLFTNLDFNVILLIYGMISIICTVLLYIFLPETKDKSLLEIEQSFVNNEYNKHCQRHIETCITV